ncbi:hypothetical protein D5F01_LYC17063 [Scomber scombrus]|uniref:Uncharacterized protein n=1 Tax=Scomber scombrus TaxID=13677 RepID=A0AAV1QHJ0_SCOSC
MISRMVEILADMIKPAAPTQRTVDLITGNAENWVHTTRLILEEHYEAGIKDLMEELTGLLTPEWKTAFKVAVRWAKRNLPCITKDEIDHAEALITAKIDTRDTAQGQGPQQVEVPTQTQGPQKPPESRKSVATMTEQPDQGPDGHQEVPWFESPQEHSLTQRDAITARRVLPEKDRKTEESDDSEESEAVDIPIHASTQVDLQALFEEDHSREEESREEGNVLTPQTSGQDVSQVSYEDAQEEDVFEEG